VSLTRVLLWAGAIVLICYMFGLSPKGIVSDVTNAVQQVHNSSTTGGHP
jgi:hypothetical protein